MFSICLFLSFKKRASAFVHFLAKRIPSVLSGLVLWEFTLHFPIQNSVYSFSKKRIVFSKWYFQDHRTSIISSTESSFPEVKIQRTHFVLFMKMSKVTVLGKKGYHLFSKCLSRRLQSNQIVIVVNKLFLLQNGF